MQQSSHQADSEHRAGKRSSVLAPATSLKAPGKLPASDIVGVAFRKYNDSLVRYLSVRLRSLRDAEDVAQEAYARMLKLDEPETISHLQAYLFKIASNIAIDRLRRQGRQPQHLPLDGITDGIPAPAMAVDRIVEAKQQLSLIRDIVEELPPKCRQAFLLYKFQDRSYREISVQMQLTESMIRKYVLRAIAYCRERLDDTRIETNK